MEGVSGRPVNYVVSALCGGVVGGGLAALTAFVVGKVLGEKSLCAARNVAVIGGVGALLSGGGLVLRQLTTTAALANLPEGRRRSESTYTRLEGERHSGTTSSAFQPSRPTERQRPVAIVDHSDLTFRARQLDLEAIRECGRLEIPIDDVAVMLADAQDNGEALEALFASGCSYDLSKLRIRDHWIMNASVLDAILNHCIGPMENAHLKSLLFTAIEQKQERSVEVLLRHDADPSEPYLGVPALHTAVSSKSYAILRILLDRVKEGKGNVDASEALRGETALYRAVEENDLEATQLLLEYGANPLAVSRIGLSVVDVAVWHSATDELLKALLDKTPEGAAELNRPNYMLLYRVCKRGNTELVRTLVAKGADPALLVRGEGCQTTPLHFAARDGSRLELLRALTHKGCNLEVLDGNGKTPLDVARECNQQLMVNEMLEIEARRERLPDPVSVQAAQDLPGNAQREETCLCCPIVKYPKSVSVLPDVTSPPV